MINRNRPKIFHRIVCVFIGHKQVEPGPPGQGTTFKLMEITRVDGTVFIVQMCERCTTLYGYKET